MEFSWPMIGAIAVIVSAVGTIALLWLRTQLSKDFVPKTLFDEFSRKVTTMEHDLRTAPTHRDIQALSDRVRAVEVGVAVVQETVASMKDGMVRIDRGVARIEEHLLETSK